MIDFFKNNKTNIFKIFVYNGLMLLQSYLASGKPIIGSIDGIASQIINNSNCGFGVSAEESINLSIQIKKFYNLPIDKEIYLEKMPLIIMRNFLRNRRLFI